MSNAKEYIKLNEKEIKNKNPKQAIKNEIGFIIEDRKLEGIILEESIKKNISIINLNKISKSGVIIKSKE